MFKIEHSMGLDDKHLDILQSVEASIVGVYHTHYDMRDYDALYALEHLIDHYRKVARRLTTSAPDLDEPASEIFYNVKQICDTRIESREDAVAIVACLRKILKSAKRWNQKNGKRGYLEFVQNYV